MADTDKKRFIAYEAYKKLADNYAERVDTKPHNAYLERPAILSMMPDVKNLKTLDAGCGTGLYSEWLVDHGAEVISVDASPQMLKHAVARLKDKADVRLHDLREPLEFIKDGSLDLVFSSLVMHYIEDWKPLLAEFKRVLKVGGMLVFSIEHPFVQFSPKYGARNYFAVEKVERWWGGFGERVLVPSFRRPLSYVFESLIECGFYVDRVLESQPTLDYRKADPEGYETTRYKPSFLCIRAICKTKI